MIGSMAREFRSLVGPLLARTLGASGLALFGASALLDRGSALVTRGAGALIALSAGFFAWLYVREIFSPGTLVRLDRDGVRVDARFPAVAFRAPWPRIVGVRLQGEAHARIAVLDFLEESAQPSEEDRYPEVSTLDLPGLIGVPAEDLAAEIERFRRAYAPAVAYGAGVPHPPRDL